MGDELKKLIAYYHAKGGGRVRPRPSRAMREANYIFETSFNGIILNLVSLNKKLNSLIFP